MIRAPSLVDKRSVALALEVHSQVSAKIQSTIKGDRWLSPSFSGVGSESLHRTPKETLPPLDGRIVALHLSPSTRERLHRFSWASPNGCSGRKWAAKETGHLPARRNVPASRPRVAAPAARAPA